MPFIPHTDNDIRTMLDAIGAPDIDALFEEIPANLRAPGLPGVPPALNEMEIGRLMTDFATRDGRPLNFIGAGAYEHHIPSAVWAIVTRESSTAPTRRTRPRRARARCSCCTSTRR